MQDKSPFSFASYNAKDFTSILKLSGKYRNSTFVHLVHDNEKQAKQQHAEAKSINVSNLVVASLTLDHTFSEKLMNCPDFFRYQLIGTKRRTQLHNSPIKLYQMANEIQLIILFV